MEFNKYTPDELKPYADYMLQQPPELHILGNKIEYVLAQYLGKNGLNRNVVEIGASPHHWCGVYDDGKFSRVSIPDIRQIDSIYRNTYSAVVSVDTVGQFPLIRGEENQDLPTVDELFLTIGSVLLPGGVAIIATPSMFKMNILFNDNSRPAKAADTALATLNEYYSLGNTTEQLAHGLDDLDYIARGAATINHKGEVVFFNSSQLQPGREFALKLLGKSYTRYYYSPDTIKSLAEQSGLNCITYKASVSMTREEKLYLEEKEELFLGSKVGFVKDPFIDTGLSFFVFQKK
jgi:hypothetical protein